MFCQAFIKEAFVSHYYVDSKVANFQWKFSRWTGSMCHETNSCHGHYVTTEHRMLMSNLCCLLGLVGGGEIYRICSWNNRYQLRHIFI